MSISDNYTPIKTLGNGSTVDFSGNWAVLSASYIRVAFENVTTGVQTPQLSGWTLVFDESGFTVTFSVAPTSANYVVISREIAQTQTDPYKTSKGFQGAVIENSFDKITGIAQELQNASDRSLKFPVGSSVTNPVLPTPIDGYAILWDGTTGKMRNTDVSLADLEGNAEIVADNITAINTVATNISSVNTVSTNITNVNLVASNMTDVNAVAAGMTNINTVAGAIADVSAVAGAIADVSTVADDIANVNIVATNIAAVNTVATNISDIQTVVTNIVDIQNAEENADRAEAAADALQGTSTTSNSIATGSKSFTTQAAKNFGVGRDILITSDASPATRRMSGIVTAYDSGTGALTVTVASITGSGTYTDWTLRVSGAVGETGAPGSVTDGDKGDITVSGSGATWTADPTLIQGKSTTAPATGDYMLLSDASGSDALIKATVADILALQPPSVPGLVPIARFTGTNQTSCDINSVINSTYKNYVLIGKVQPLTDNVDIAMRLSQDNGSTFLTGYSANGLAAPNSGVASVANGGYVTLGYAVGNGTGEWSNFTATIFDPANAVGYTRVESHGSAINASNHNGFQGIGGNTQTSGAVNSARVYASSGNITYDLSLYGVPNAP